MKLKTKIVPYTLHFKRPAGTSRGVYTDRKVWYVIVTDPNRTDRWGVGECSPLADLSCDYVKNYEQLLSIFCTKLEKTGELDFENLRDYPSILFGLETAMRHFTQNNLKLWDTDFSNGIKGIPINGLVWMGDFEYMQEQIATKIEEGFRCLKLKIGAIGFGEEIKLLQNIRQSFPAHQIELRVDANGAFKPDEALNKMEQLAKFDLHSIEQPIKAGQWEKMEELCKQTPLPIALDEELIGINDIVKRQNLLETIQPQYIILKPTLHGGLKGASEWIELADTLSIGWWITSALESNIGLNAIAQWSSTHNNPLPQGLGTGSLYTNNIEMPLFIQNDSLWFDEAKANNFNSLTACLK